MTRQTTRSPSKAKLARRARLEAAVERAIELLDQLDGDADFEPSLGSRSCVGAVALDCAPMNEQWDQRGWARGGDSGDREDEHDGSESSLGWPEFPRTEMPSLPMVGEAVDCEQ